MDSFARIIEELSAREDPRKGKGIEDAPDARERSRTVLGLFRIWQFLRGKLVQRTDNQFREFLWIADEYAWHCYKPIYDSGRKQPPLVFLNGGYSPFTLTRQDEFQAESVPHELLGGKSLLAAMKSLPFPVIGVPWYQVRTLADLPVIGHEVGHSVEADLELSESIANAIEGVVPKERLPRWSGWASEVFADVYGCLSCGAAFVCALASFLSSEDAGWTSAKYPPPALRFHLNLEILRALGADGVETIASDWQDVYHIGENWIDYGKDARQIPRAILDNVAVGAKSIRNLIPFEDDARRVDTLITAVKAKGVVIDGEPLRALVAAYRLAFDELRRNYGPKSIVNELPRLMRLETAMKKLLKPDVRGGERTRPVTSEVVSETAELWSGRLKDSSFQL
ncbi:MAG: hypothetical protein ABSF53_08055 [Terracidiphilus sp.]